jgi:hypothetical protein
MRDIASPYLHSRSLLLLWKFYMIISRYNKQDISIQGVLNTDLLKIPKDVEVSAVFNAAEALLDTMPILPETH